MVRLALAAGVLELLTMLPYLAAVGLLASAQLLPVRYVPLLIVYCTVMVLPALVLVGLRVVAQDRLQPPLRRLDGFLSRHADSAIGWVMGIAGFLIARDAAARLWWPHLRLAVHDTEPERRPGQAKRKGVGGLSSRRSPAAFARYSPTRFPKFDPPLLPPQLGQRPLLPSLVSRPRVGPTLHQRVQPPGEQHRASRRTA